MGFDEGVLDHVEGVILVSQDTERESVRTPMVPLEQRSKRVAISATGGIDQVVVVQVIGMRPGGRALTGVIHLGHRASGYSSCTWRRVG